MCRYDRFSQTWSHIIRGCYLISVCFIKFFQIFCIIYEQDVMLKKLAIYSFRKLKISLTFMQLQYKTGFVRLSHKRMYSNAIRNWLAVFFKIGYLTSYHTAVPLTMYGELDPLK